MTTPAELSATLSDALALKLPPVGLALVDEIPAGVAQFDGVVPAGCAFWERAASGVFATTTADHELCAIGVHTHRLADPGETHASELGRVLQVMADMTYVRDEDVAAIPVLERGARHVVYGPVADMPVAVDCVLVFADARQGLVLSEAIGQVEMAAAPALGRPACALVPQVVNSGRAAQSLGCCGARAYLDALTDDVTLWGLPGATLGQYVERVAALAKANGTLASFHELRRADVEAGKRPTVDESLGRLG